MNTIDLTALSSDPPDDGAEQEEEAEEKESNEDESAESEASETSECSVPSYARNWIPQDPGSESYQRSSSIESTISDKMTTNRKPPPVIISDEKILSYALKDTPALLRRNALRKIFAEVPAARDIALKELTIYEDHLLEESLLEPGHPDDDNDTMPEDFEFGKEECDWRWGQALIDKPWWKQRCAKYDICRRCKQEFELEYNDSTSCSWHPGEKFVDDEVHGERFRWDCCDEVVNDDLDFGCEEGRHLRTRKRPSISKKELPKKRIGEEVGDLRKKRQRVG